MVAFSWLWAAVLMAGAALVVIDRHRTPPQLIPAVPQTAPSLAALVSDDRTVARTQAYLIELKPTASTLVFE